MTGEPRTVRETYAGMYDRAPVGIATLCRNGCIRHLNATGAKIFGRPREQLIGKPLFPLVTLGDRREFLNYLTQVRRGDGPLLTELHFFRADTTKMLLQLVSELGFGNDNKLDHIRTVFSDVTAQKRNQADLNESRAELAAIVASAMDAIISITAGQCIVQFNSAAEIMFRCRSDKAIGQTFSRFLAASSRRFLEHLANDTGLCGPPGALYEILGRRADGEEFPLEASFSNIQVKGEKRLTFFLRDITERKRAEGEIRWLNERLELRVRERTAQLETANRELREEIAERIRLQQELLAISEREQRRIGQDLHDGIGQLLTGIMLLNDTHLKRLDHTDPAESAESRRMAELLVETRRQVRQLSRGLHPVASTPDGLMAALQELAESIQMLHGVECRFRCPNPVMLEDNLVATHLFRIAQEAVHNAIRHGRSKHIQVMLGIDGGSLCLRVRDDGRPSCKRITSESNGLGLSIMKSRCETIGGSLRIRSVRPRGTCIDCTAPVPQADPIRKEH